LVRFKKEIEGRAIVDGIAALLCFPNDRLLYKRQKSAGSQVCYPTPKSRRWSTDMAVSQVKKAGERFLGLLVQFMQ